MLFIFEDRTFFTNPPMHFHTQWAPRRSDRDISRSAFHGESVSDTDGSAQASTNTTINTIAQQESSSASPQSFYTARSQVSDSASVTPLKSPIDLKTEHKLVHPNLDELDDTDASLPSTPVAFIPNNTTLDLSLNQSIPTSLSQLKRVWTGPTDMAISSPPKNHWVRLKEQMSLPLSNATENLVRSL